MEIGNTILNNQFEATILMTAFLVQVLLPKHNNFQIDTLMNTLKESGMWISINENLSAEKPISKWLADELTTIMELSTPHQRNKYQPDPEEYFRYHNNLEKDKFNNACLKKRGSIGCSTLKCCQVKSTPTISKTHSTKIRQ
jgi:hypothetical protein